MALRRALERIVEHGRRLLDAPSPIWRPPHAWHRLTPARGQDLISRLRRDGLVMMPDFLSKGQLASIQDTVDAQVTAPLAEHMVFSQSQHYYSSRQPLTICPEFVEAAADSDLINVVSGYLRRRPFIAESDFRRVLPLDMVEYERENPNAARGYTPSHWHHDLHGREVKVMIYLTDVGPDDQNFTYCFRSHRGFRTLKYERSRFSDEAVQGKKFDIIECFASAGTAILFDSSGIHRLRRRKTSRVRDSVTFYYRPGRKGLAVPLSSYS